MQWYKITRMEGQNHCFHRILPHNINLEKSTKNRKWLLYSTLLYPRCIATIPSMLNSSFWLPPPSSSSCHRLLLLLTTSPPPPNSSFFSSHLLFLIIPHPPNTSSSWLYPTVPPTPLYPHYIPTVSSPNPIYIHTVSTLYPHCIHHRHHHHH